MVDNDIMGDKMECLFLSVVFLLFFPPMLLFHSVLNPFFYEAYVDEKNKVVSTPSFMWETDFHYHYIFDGIGNMVKHVMRMSTKWAEVMSWRQK